MTTPSPKTIGPFSDSDIFSIYDCLRNDKEQKRFMTVLDFVRQTVMNTIGNPPDSDHPFPSASAYLTAISFLIIQQLKQHKTDGLAELLKLFHVAIQITSALDSSVATQLLDLLPLFSTDNTELLTQLCPSLCDLTKHTPFTSAQIDNLIAGLCSCALSDNPNLRKSACLSIYNTPPLIEPAFSAMMHKLDENQLRALTVISNIVCRIKPSEWKSHANTFITLCNSSNRSVRVKALNIVANGLHFFSPENVIDIVKRFTATVPQAPGDVLIALSELIQSAITMLAHNDIHSLSSNFPGFVKKLLDFFSIADTEAEKLIHNIFLYGIHALLNSEIDPVDKGTSVMTTIEILTNALSVTQVSIWPQLYNILSTLPSKVHELTNAMTPEMLSVVYSRSHSGETSPEPPSDSDLKTLFFLNSPIVATLSKLQDVNVSHHESMVTFLVDILDSVGLKPFFDQYFSSTDSSDPLTNQTIFDAVLIPSLSAYKSRKHPTDLIWTISRIFQSGYETSLFAAAIEDEARRLWFNLWNALPSAFTCPSNFDLNTLTVNDGDELSFPDFIERRLTWPSPRESFLLRPIARIIAQIPSQFLSTPIDFFRILLDISVAQNCSSVILPTFEALANSMPSSAANEKFTSLMANEILVLGQESETIMQARSMVDVALSLLPFLTEDNRLALYQILLSFIRKPNQFQKTGFKAMRKLLSQYGGMPGINLDELRAALEATAQGTGRSSSAIRYRLNLMVAILEHAGEHYPELVNAFLPEFVAALKESGIKTRAAGADGLLQIVSSGDQKRFAVVLSALAVGLAGSSSDVVSATIEAADMIIGRYFAKIEPGLIESLCEVLWKSAQANQASAAVLRSATKFAKTMIKQLNRLVEASQLPVILCLGAACAKSSNWDIQKKGRKLIAKCIDTFGQEKVAASFPPAEIKLLRGVRKEARREARDNLAHKNVDGVGDEEGFKFDPNDGDVDLTNPAISVSKQTTTVDENGDEFEQDQDGKLVLKIPTREERKKKTAKVVDVDDNDFGNEVSLQIRNRRQIAEEKRRRDTAAFVQGGISDLGKGKNDRKSKFNGHKGKSGSDVKIVPLSSKTVNKRFKGQMKATYKQLFKTSH